jgi:hypothetical protein
MTHPELIFKPLATDFTDFHEFQPSEGITFSFTLLQGKLFKIRTIRVICG